MNDISRRDAVRLGLTSVAALAVGAPVAAEPGRLTSRHRSPTREIAPGTHQLTNAGAPDALLVVPSAYSRAQPAPLVLLLHGATGRPEGIVRRVSDECEKRGIVVLAPKSEGSTWDAIRGRYGNDVAAIDALLATTFDRVRIDPRQVNISGFSDGATYALTLGLINGDLFQRVIAFSPGFIVPGARQGRPSVYISHGRADDILPIDRCGRRIAAELRRDRYPVRFDEFEGGHTVPPDIQAKAFDWMLK